jgi:hypothetical protein
VSSTIKFTKTETVSITLTEDDVQNAIMAYLANRLNVPNNAEWRWDVSAHYEHDTNGGLNGVSVKWTEAPETIIDEVLS